MVSYYCASGSLADKEIYPTFTRTVPNILALLPGAYAATIDAFGRVAQLILYLLQLFYPNASVLKGCAVFYGTRKFVWYEQMLFTCFNQLYAIVYLQLDGSGRNHHLTRRPPCDECNSHQRPS